MGGGQQFLADSVNVERLLDRGEPVAHDVGYMRRGHQARFTSTLCIDAATVKLPGKEGMAANLLRDHGRDHDSHHDSDCQRIVCRQLEHDQNGRDGRAQHCTRYGTQPNQRIGRMTG